MRSSLPSYRSRIVFLALISVLGAASCHQSPPPRWSEGGALLAIPQARWERDREVIEIRANGEVWADDDLVFVIDRVGRVYDADREPLAVLEPHGQLIAKGDQSWGHVGYQNASAPQSTEAWLSVSKDGTVRYFDSEGDETLAGRWQGCEGPTLPTCTLVTQLFTMQRYLIKRNSGVRIGVGFGVYR
jgi:hypothetical protein